MSEVRFPMQPLSALTTALKDGTHGTHRRVVEGVPLLSAKNITANGDIAIDDTDDLISEAEYLDLTRSFRLEPNDLLLTIVGSLGRRAIYSGQRITFQRSVAYVRPQQQKVVRRFLFHWMGHPSFSAELARRSNATAQAGLYLGELAKVSVPVPEIREQGVVTQILDTLDTAIHATEAIIAKLKAVKQGLLHDLLTRGLDANGELRPPQAEAPHLYEETDQGWIPSGWDIRPLSEYTSSEITYGIVQAGPHVANGVPYIRTGDMSGDALVRETMLCTSRRIASSYARSEVRAGDIVMAIRATVGKVLRVPSDLDGANLTQGTAKISPDARTDGAFLLWAIRHSRAQRAIQLEIKGTTFAEITLGALRQVPVAAPVEINEQREIGRRLTAIDMQLRSEQQYLAKVHAQKSALMDDLLTGRVRVTPLLTAEHPQKSA